MCPLRWPLLALLLRIVTATNQEGGDDIERCLRGGGSEATDCLQGLGKELLEKALVPDRLRLVEGLELVRTNRTARGLADLANRTLDIDIVDVANGLAKDSRSRKKRRMFAALILTALIAAKGAAILTAANIMVPLALKMITLLAMKALVIGKIAVVVASAFGFLRLISGTTEHTTEVIYDHQPQHHQKRVEQKKWVEPVHIIPPGYTLLRKEPPVSGGHHFQQHSESGGHHFQQHSESGGHHFQPHHSGSGGHHFQQQHSGSGHHFQPHSGSGDLFQPSSSGALRYRPPSSSADRGAEGLQHFRLPQLSLQTLPPPIVVKTRDRRR